MLLTDAIEALCIATRADGRSPRTVYAYREKLGHLVNFLDDVDVESITVNDLRGFLATQWDKGLSPFTILTRIRAFKRLFNWLVEEEIISVSPAKRIRTPNPEPEPKSLKLETIVKIMSVCDDSQAGRRDRAIILFLLDSGCRVAGVCGLKLAKLDLDKRLAKVTEKGNKSRFVMFTDTTVDALCRWLEVRPKYQVDNVFVSLKRKKELSPNGVWQMVNRRSRDAGFEKAVSVHGFRHTFAVNYLMNGGDLASLSEILGHKDVSTTKRWYGNFSLNQLQVKHEQHSPVAKMMKEKKK